MKYLKKFVGSKDLRAPSVTPLVPCGISVSSVNKNLHGDGLKLSLEPLKQTCITSCFLYVHVQQLKMNFCQMSITQLVMQVTKNQAESWCHYLLCHLCPVVCVCVCVCVSEFQTHTNLFETGSFVFYLFFFVEYVRRPHLSLITCSFTAAL